MKKNITIKTYESGARLIVENDPSARYITFCVEILAGAGYELPEEFGVAHLLEHMMFKSSKKYSTAEIYKTMDSVGAVTNARTSTARTMYHFKCLKESFDICADVYGDMLTNPLFLEDELKSEKKVVLEEIDLWEDDLENYAYVEAYTAFKSNYLPLAHKVLGTKDTVKSITPQRLRSFMNRYYYGKNMIFSILGDISPDEASKVIEKYFVKFLNKSSQPTETVSLPTEITPSAPLIVVNRDVNQVKLFLLINAVNAAHEDAYTARIYARILGLGESSRLYSKVREQEGLAYAVYASLGLEKEFGYIEIFAGINLENLEKTINEIVAIMKDMAQNGVSDFELNKAKMMQKAKLAYMSDGKEGTCLANPAELDIYGTIREDDEIVELIERVTKEDVQRFAQKIYNEKTVVVCAGGKNIDVTTLNLALKR